MKRSPLKPISPKQAIKNRLWKEIGDQKACDLHYLCQWSGELGHRGDPESLHYLDAHHILKRRYNNWTYENCFMVKRKYHEEADRAKLPFPDTNEVGWKYKKVSNGS